MGKKGRKGIGREKNKTMDDKGRKEKGLREHSTLGNYDS